MMPQAKTQGAVFGLLMSYFMALGMEAANVAHKLGAMSNAVFLPALKETAFMGAIVFVVSTLYGSRAGQHIAHRFVQPGRNNPLLVTLAVSGCTVMVMCPSMSLQGRLRAACSARSFTSSSWKTTAKPFLPTRNVIRWTPEKSRCFSCMTN